MNKLIPQAFAQALADKLTKAGQERAAKSGYTSPDYSIHLEIGPKYIRLVQSDGGYQSHVHAFIERSTNHLIKAASWKAPQKDVNGSLAYRYDLSTPEGFAEALYNANFSGGYLYADYVPVTNEDREAEFMKLFPYDGEEEFAVTVSRPQSRDGFDF